MQSAEFESHLIRVFSTFGILVNSLENGQLIEQLVSHLRKQHQSRPGMEQKYMKVIIYEQDTTIAN